MMPSTAAMNSDISANFYGTVERSTKTNNANLARPVFHYTLEYDTISVRNCITETLSHK